MGKVSKASSRNPDGRSAFASAPRGTTALISGSPVISPYIPRRTLVTGKSWY
ncbi:predicted protein [Botrytis cinerea T4]|uniref:Uncharacterized protein n=1 Tax=Botryotinia fuckeliana (strain T4) TaxID=999810 RepID=G2YX95_BOTF4|nr:predicted protein [Botrytis cinerea T4]